MGKSLLFLVSGLTIITGIMQVNNAERMETIPEKTVLYYQEQQARNLSKSLVDNAIERMKDNNDWTGSIDLGDVANISSITQSNKSSVLGNLLSGVGNTISNTTNTVDNTLASTISTLVDGNLTTYTMNSENIPDDNSVGTWDQYKALFVSETTFEGINVQTEVLMQRDSFSKYAYMTQSERGANGDDIWFMGDDEIYGPIHTNGTFKMSGDPSFYGLITSPNMWDAHDTNPTDPNFYGGENFNAPEKDAPTSYELTKLVNAANNGGLRFDDDIEVVFRATEDAGYVDIINTTTTRERVCYWFGCYYTDVTSTSTDTYTTDEFNGVISTEGRVKVEGVVKGEVTLHAEEDIEIMGDITYFTNPEDDSSSTDILGLVSEEDVFVDRNAHRASGSSDIDIQASIMALNTSFTVENYSSDSPRGVINLYGGIIQKNRGPVGTFSGNTVVSGYTKNYRYDARLKGYIPPAFPRESIFSVVYWKDKVSEIAQDETQGDDDVAGSDDGGGTTSGTGGQ